MIISHFPTAGGGGGDYTTGKVFEYTGEYQLSTQGENWEARFLTSGTLTMLRNASVDLFLVGGGGAGGVSERSTETHDGIIYSQVKGGGGGAGGYVTNAQAENMENRAAYEITIGAGGIAASAVKDGGETSIVGMNIVYTASGGGAAGSPSGIYPGKGGNNGGTGASIRWYSQWSSGANTWTYSKHDGDAGGESTGASTRAFGEVSGELFAGAGGGAGGRGQTGRGSSSYVILLNGAGGAGGGGAGGTEEAGENGGANTGGGGGGGGGQIEAGMLGGDGGSGILIMRNAR